MMATFTKLAGFLFGGCHWTSEFPVVEEGEICLETCAVCNVGASAFGSIVFAARAALAIRN